MYNHSMVTGLPISFLMVMLTGYGQEAPMSGNAAVASNITEAEVVILPATPTVQESFAAQELATYAGKILGRTVPVVAETEPAAATATTRYWIGRTRQCRVPGLNDQEWILQPGPEGLAIYGGGSRGTIYGVYQFLENQGVRWLTPTAEVVPRAEHLRLPRQTERQQAKTRVRYLAWNVSTPRTAEWNSRLRLVGVSADMPDAMGGHLREATGGQCHSLVELVPIRLFKDHPDWFAQQADGRRSPGSYPYVGHCLSNPALRAYVAGEVKKALRKTGAQEMWIGQADGLRAGCYCRACTAERDRYTTVPPSTPQTAAAVGDDTPLIDPTKTAGGNVCWSINNILFANAIGAQIKREFPAVSLLTLAYGFTSEAPPARLRVADNVVVNLATAGSCCWFHGMKPGANRQLNDWAKVAPRLRVYTYGGANFGFWWPFPNLLAHAQDFASLYHDGVTEFFDQGTLSSSGVGAGLIELRCYLSARMMWNPEANPREVIREFCNGFYGPAGEAVAAYIFWYDNYVAQHNVHGSHEWGDTLGWQKWVNQETVAKSEAFLATALAAVADQPELTQRVKRGLLEITWARWALSMADKGRVEGEVFSFFKPGTVTTGRTAAKTFCDVMQASGFTALSEVAPWHGMNSPQGITARPLPVVYLGTPGRRVTIVPGLGGRIVAWENAGLGADFIRAPGAFTAAADWDAMDGGFGEYTVADFYGYCQKSTPGYTEPLTVESKPTDGVVTMSGTLSNGLKLTRVYAYRGDTIRISSRYTNTGSTACGITPVAHLPLNFQVFGEARFMNAEGTKEDALKRASYPVVVKNGLSWARMTIPKLGGTSLLVRFPAANVQAVNVRPNGSNLRPHETCIALDLVGKPVSLAPADSIEFSYEITVDK